MAARAMGNHSLGTWPFRPDLLTPNVQPAEEDLERRLSQLHPFLSVTQRGKHHPQKVCRYFTKGSQRCPIHAKGNHLS